MTIYYQINTDPTGGVLSVFGDVTGAITSDSRSYAEAVEYLTSTAPEDLSADKVSSLINPREGVNKYLSRVSERISLRGSTLLFDGDPVDTSLTRLIISLSSDDSGGDPAKLVRFLENLMTNPSENSREQLYTWISDRDMTITSDGHFLAYKGLNTDFTSIHAGPGIVNSIEYEGRTNLDNSPGNVVEMARSKVDPNTYVGCSTGLHAGVYEYASMFSHGAIVLVKINPRDVVSVPRDCASQKLRVSRYEVLSSVTEELTSSVYRDETEDEDEGEYSWEQDAYDSPYSGDSDPDEYEESDVIDEEDGERIDKFAKLRNLLS